MTGNRIVIIDDQVVRDRLASYIFRELPEGYEVFAPTTFAEALDRETYRGVGAVITDTDLKKWPEAEAVNYNGPELLRRLYNEGKLEPDVPIIPVSVYDNIDYWEEPHRDNFHLKSDIVEIAQTLLALLGLKSQ
ncbi:MAG: hypothetical protein ISS48_02975 [Candidatus Aenigmarchaeota archaeon]|nr:hypothetical protein [Candidatus Aenigmarchaeota archaeon]